MLQARTRSQLWSELLRYIAGFAAVHQHSHCMATASCYTVCMAVIVTQYSMMPGYLWLCTQLISATKALLQLAEVMQVAHADTDSSPLMLSAHWQFAWLLDTKFAGRQCGSQSWHIRMRCLLQTLGLKRIMLPDIICNHVLPALPNSGQVSHIAYSALIISSGLTASEALNPSLATKIINKLKAHGKVVTNYGIRNLKDNFLHLPVSLGNKVWIGRLLLTYCGNSKPLCNALMHNALAVPLVKVHCRLFRHCKSNWHYSLRIVHSRFWTQSS